MKFPLGTQFTFGSLTFTAGENGDLNMLPPGPAPEHLLLLLHLHQVVSAQVWIILQGYTSAPPSSFGVFRSRRPPSGHSSEHRVRLRRHRPPVEIHLMTTPRSGSTSAGTPQRTTASFLWWPQTGIGSATAPVDIPLLED
jgi:hypothetical protein